MLNFYVVPVNPNFGEPQISVKKIEVNNEPSPTPEIQPQTLEKLEPPRNDKFYIKAGVVIVILLVLIGVLIAIPEKIVTALGFTLKN